MPEATILENQDSFALFELLFVPSLIVTIFLNNLFSKCLGVFFLLGKDEVEIFKLEITSSILKEGGITGWLEQMPI